MQIEFFADAGKFKAVKKLKITDEIKDIDIARFLASVHETMDRKMWEYIGNEFDLEKLDAIAGDICGAEKTKKGWAFKGRVSEDKINEVLTALKSPTTTKKIKEVAPTKKGIELAKAYVTRQCIEIMGFPIEPDPKLIEKYIDEKSQL